MAKLKDKVILAIVAGTIAVVGGFATFDGQKYYIDGGLTGSTQIYANQIDDLSYDEYLAYLEMINHEIAVAGGMTFKNVASGESIIDMIHKRATDRVETEKVTLAGNELSAEEYETKKSDLLSNFK